MIVGWFIALFNRAGMRWLGFSVVVAVAAPLIRRIIRAADRRAVERTIECYEQQVESIRAEVAQKNTERRRAFEMSPEVLKLKGDLAFVRHSLQALKDIR